MKNDEVVTGISTVWVVEGNPILQRTISQISKEEGWYLRATASGGSLLTAIDLSSPACVVIGQDLTDMTGFELFDRLLQMHRYVQVVMVADSWYLADVVNVMKMGASEVLETVSDVEKYRVAIANALRADRENRERRKRSVPASILSKLTSEEARIFQLIAQGLTAKQVSVELDMSVRTIHYRKKELLKKLGCSDRNEALELCRNETRTDSPL